MNRVGKRRANRCAGRFTRPNRLFGWTIDQLYVDLGHAGEPQDRIARPIHAHNAGAIEHHLFHQHAADGLQDAALDLCAHAIGINDLPAIMRTRDSFDRDLSAGPVDRDLHPHAHIGFAVLVVHK